MSTGNPLLLCLALLTVTASFAAWEPVDAGRQKRTPRYTAEGAAGCLHCHSGPRMRAVESGPHFNLQRPDAPAAGNYCESCHGPGSIHVSRAHGGRGFPPLIAFGRGADRSPRDEQIAACLGCHNDEGTVSRPIFFDGSPHDRGSINCSTCHTVHGESATPAGNGSHTAICGRCHRRQLSDHPRPGGGSGVDDSACSACHDVHSPAAVAE